MVVDLTSISKQLRPYSKSDWEALKDFMIESSKGRADVIEKLDEEGRQHWAARWAAIQRKKRGQLQLLHTQNGVDVWLGFTVTEPGICALDVRFNRDRYSLQQCAKMLQTFTAELFKQLELVRIELRCTADDNFAREVYTKAEFRLEGTLRQALSTRSMRVDAAVFGILKSDISV